MRHISGTMHTPLTDLLQISVPVIAAPMAGISGPDVAAAVAKAGGLGLIGAGYIEPDRLTSMCNAALQQLNSTAEANGAVAVGLINFACSQVRTTRTLQWLFCQDRMHISCMIHWHAAQSIRRINLNACLLCTLTLTPAYWWQCLLTRRAVRTNIWHNALQSCIPYLIEAPRWARKPCTEAVHGLTSILVDRNSCKRSSTSNPGLFG